MKLFLFTLTFMGFLGFATAQSLPENLYPTDSLSIKYHSSWTKNHYPERIKEFKKAPLTMGDIVFLGNSITELGGDWGKRLGWSSSVKNRGISGDVTEGVLKRLGEITYVKPKAVFLLIGINEIFNTFTTPEYVVDNILAISKNIRKASPHTKLYVQTILPTATLSIKEKIQQTNTLLQKNSGHKTYTLFNIHVLFADEADVMKKEYTVDGTHLNEEGYAIWTDYLKKQVPFD
jgi:lysophospholipase L1-like esterase